MSTPGANPALTATTPAPEKKSGFSILGGFELLAGILFFFLVVLGPGLSAAKLSYDKYQSILWAILDFFFAVFYIPYYAFFLNTPTQQSAFGGRRRR